jgi:hypothetical protein
MIIFILILLICTSSAYDEKLSKHAVNLAQASYSVSNIDSWNCITCDSSIILTNIVENKGARALQGYDSELDTLFVSYRGSSNIENWMDNIQVKKINPYNDTNIEVENGFYKEYSSIKSEVMSNLNELSQKYNTKEIFLTGHSAGGSLATLTAFDILSIYREYEVKYLITFGSPRVGNSDFSHYFNKFSFTSYRVTHYYDMVPHVPEEFLGYLHLSNEVWYNKENSEYKSCNDLYDEDSRCSNSCSPTHCTSTSDHLYYLNVTMGNED